MASSTLDSSRTALEVNWNLIPVLRHPTFKASDLARSYDALLDLLYDDAELTNNERRDGGVITTPDEFRSRSSGHMIDVYRNLQFVCAVLLEVNLLDLDQSSVVATSFERARRALQAQKVSGGRIHVDEQHSEIDDSVLDDLHVETVSEGAEENSCLRYRWSIGSRSLDVDLCVDRAALAEEAEELWRMAQTPIPNEDEAEDEDQ